MVYLKTTYTYYTDVYSVADLEGALSIKLHEIHSVPSMVHKMFYQLAIT